MKCEFWLRPIERLSSELQCGLPATHTVLDRAGVTCGNYCRNHVLHSPVELWGRNSGCTVVCLQDPDLPQIQQGLRVRAKLHSRAEWDEAAERERNGW